MNENKDIATRFPRICWWTWRQREARVPGQSQSLSDVKSPRVNKLTGNPNPTVADGVRWNIQSQWPAHLTSKNKAPPEELSSPSGSKGKRKVTFDIKPVVPRGEGEAEVDEEPGEGQAPVRCPESLV